MAKIFHFADLYIMSPEAQQLDWRLIQTDMYGLVTYMLGRHRGEYPGDFLQDECEAEAVLQNPRFLRAEKPPKQKLDAEESVKWVKYLTNKLGDVWQVEPLPDLLFENLERAKAELRSWSKQQVLAESMPFNARRTRDSRWGILRSTWAQMLLRERRMRGLPVPSHITDS